MEARPIYYMKCFNFMHNHLTYSKQYSVLVSRGHFESPFCGLLNVAKFIFISSSIDIIFFSNDDKQGDWTYFFFNFTRKIHILITKKIKHCAKFGFFNFIQTRLLFHESNHFSVFINSDLELLLSSRTISSLYPYK